MVRPFLSNRDLLNYLAWREQGQQVFKPHPMTRTLCHSAAKNQPLLLS